jgi:hypothetical protein
MIKNQATGAVTALSVCSSSVTAKLRGTYDSAGSVKEIQNADAIANRRHYATGRGETLDMAEMHGGDCTEAK